MTKNNAFSLLSINTATQKLALQRSIIKQDFLVPKIFFHYRLMRLIEAVHSLKILPEFLKVQLLFVYFRNNHVCLLQEQSCLFTLGTIIECTAFKRYMKFFLLNILTDKQVRHLALELCLLSRKCNQTLGYDCSEMSSNPSYYHFGNAGLISF